MDNKKSFPVYDYENQAWMINGHYVSCNHPEDMHCSCYGKLHAGEKREVPGF